MKEHKVIQMIIPEDQLEVLDEQINEVCEREYNKDLVKEIADEFKCDNRLPFDEIEELAFYSVYTNSPDDICFITENNMCTGCGNCCKTKKNIYLSKEKYHNLPENLKIFMEPDKDNKKFYKLKETQPCAFYSEEYGCLIYEYRPEGCKAFPLVFVGGRVVPLRDIGCGYIKDFFKLKTDVMIQRILCERGEIEVLKKYNYWTEYIMDNLG